MEALTKAEAREFCRKQHHVTDEDILEYEGDANSHKLKIKIPAEHRGIVALARDILLFRGPFYFSGGLVWLQRWDIGVFDLVRPGWRILEDVRRAHGDLRSLDIAPAQFFRHDELVELHVFLIQIMAYEWNAYFVPGGEYFFEIRESGKMYCEAKSTDTLEELSTALRAWEPTWETI